MDVRGSSFFRRFLFLLCGCGGEKNISSLGSRLRPAGAETVRSEGIRGETQKW